MDEFDAALTLSEAPARPGDSKGSKRFRATAPESMAGGGVGFAFMYGGYLNALAMRAALLAAGKQYPHPLTVNMDFISGVKKGEEIEIFVETTKSTRRLLFLRISVGSPSGLALTASGLFGTLSTGDSSKDGPTQLDERYDLARQLPNSPSLSFSDSSLPSNIIADAIDLLPGADKMMLMDKGPLNYMDFFGIRYPREAAAEVAKAVNEGRLRKETWDKAHRMPYIVAHPSGRRPDFLSAAFYSDLFPALKHVQIALGPTLPSVTISITLHFCKPFNPDSRFLYMQSSVPFMDRMERGLKTEGFVESFESAVWGEKGELVCLQRQQRLVTGREAPSRYETGGGKALL